MRCLFRRLLLSLVVLGLAPGLLFAEEQSLSSILKPARLGRASLRLEKRGETLIPVLTLVGTPAQRGEQQGTLLAPGLRKLEELMNKDVLLRGAMLITTRTRKVLADALPAAEQEETRALARASGISEQTAFFFQVAPDAFKSLGCSVLVADERKAGGDFLFGRNLDYRNFTGRFHESSVITRVFPKRGYAYVAVGFMGQTGVLSGINEHGLTITVTEISDGALGEGQPYMSRYRQVLETCRTLEEAVALLKSQRITTNNTLVIADPSGSIGVAEQAPEKVMLRRPENGARRIFQTNHYLIEEMRAFEGGRSRKKKTPEEIARLRARYEATTRRDRSSWGRFYTCGDADLSSSPGKLTRARLIRALDGANQGGATIQSMIFHPADRSVEVAFGTPPTSRLPFHRFEGKALFTAPPASLEQPAPVPDAGRKGPGSAENARDRRGGAGDEEFKRDSEKKTDAKWLPVEPEPAARARFTVRDRLRQYGAVARSRMAPWFRRASVPYPPARFIFAAFKQERRFEVYAPASDGSLRFIRSYPILGASGALGPKLREGDRQVPEGAYRLTALNPNSRSHLSIRVDYPSKRDMVHARAEGRDKPGSDIFVHGGSGSVGCIAVGDRAAEDLFVLAADTGLRDSRIVISPVDFRARDLPAEFRPPTPWTAALHDELRLLVTALPKGE